MVQNKSFDVRARGCLAALLSGGTTDELSLYALLSGPKSRKYSNYGSIVLSLASNKSRSFASFQKLCMWNNKAAVHYQWPNRKGGRNKQSSTPSCLRGRGGGGWEGKQTASNQCKATSHPPQLDLKAAVVKMKGLGLVALLLAVGLAQGRYPFRKQRYTVQMKLMCGDKPASNVRVRLVDHDTGPPFPSPASRLSLPD